ARPYGSKRGGGPMKRIFGLLIATTLVAPLLAEEPKPLPSDPLQARLARIFDRQEVEPKTLGPFRWMDNGKAYTPLENVPGSKDAKDLVRYDTATGTRRVLVPATRLVASSPSAPSGTSATPNGTKLPAAAKPLDVEDYAWSDDGKK